MSKPSSPYTPRPDTLVGRVYAHLQEHGGTLSSAEVASLFDVPTSCVLSGVKSALLNGHLERVVVEGSRKLYLRLPDGAPAAAATGAPAGKNRKARRTNGPTKARAARAAAEREDGGDSGESHGVGDAGGADHDGADAPTTGPVACLWDDGDIVLHGLDVNADGATATITPAHARRLHAFLDRLYGTPVARPVQGGGGLVYAAHMPTPPLMLAEGRTR